MAKFKDRLKELREQHEYSQRELAKRLGVSASTVGMWESGSRKPDIETMEAITDFFNVSMDYMTGKEDVTERFVNPAEVKLLDSFRCAPEDVQNAIIRLLEYERHTP